MTSSNELPGPSRTGRTPVSYASGPASVPLLGETIGANLERTVARVPDNEAFVSRHQGERVTYAAFDERVDVLARGLMDLGLEKGDRVGLWSPNYLEWALVQYATAKIGVILVNVNPAYRSHELRYALGQSSCRLLIAAPSYKTSDYLAMAASVAGELAALERTIALWSPEWDAVLSAGAQAPMDRLRARQAALDFDEPINIQYTSGTTGFPKGATLSHHNILNNGFFVGEGCRFTDQDRVCVPVPYYHCFGMVMGNLGATTHGACVVLPAPSFEARAVLEAVEAERCTALYGVPSMFIAELNEPGFASFDLVSLRTGIMAGSPCPVEVMKRCVADMHMEEVTICYGMTETSPVSTQTGVDDPLGKRVGTVGRAHPHLEVKVVDPGTGRAVDVGASGELCTRGYSVMLGYWDDPARTAEVIDEARWMHTGDLATMDDDGYLNIIGRIKDMIIRGGENVYPREIEEFLYGHEDVVDVQVIGVPDETYGEAVMAWVKRRDGSALTEEDVRAYCRGQIAHFKVPRYVAFVDEFPMTVTGKIQKFKMREQAVEMLGLGGAASITTA